MDKKPPVPPAELEPIPGDTYALRAELKALGAVWDKDTRTWRIAADTLPLATALVEHQALIPPKTPPVDENGEMIDPFEDDSGPRLTTLDKHDGVTYEARDALKAVGARWDKAARNWTIREERAPYARAVLQSVAASPSVPTSPTRANKPQPEPQTEPEPQATPPRQAPAPPPAAVRETRPSFDTQPETPPAPDTASRDTTGLVRLGGLWHSRGKDGRQYLAGKLTPGVKILIFKNAYKTAENHPSHIIYLAPVEPEDPNNREP